MNGGFVNPLARRRVPGYREAIDRFKAVTREQLHLANDIVISVTELSCRDPGCPDVETIVAILTVDKKPRMIRFHKRIIEIDGPELAAALHEVES